MSQADIVKPSGEGTSSEEVVKAHPRRYTAEYKSRILQETESSECLVFPGFAMALCGLAKVSRNGEHHVNRTIITGYFITQNLRLELNHLP